MWHGKQRKVRNACGKVELGAHHERLHLETLLHVSTIEQMSDDLAITDFWLKLHLIHVHIVIWIADESHKVGDHFEVFHRGGWLRFVDGRYSRNNRFNGLSWKAVVR